MNMITLSLLAALLFFGGYNLPQFLPETVKTAWFRAADRGRAVFRKGILFCFSVCLGTLVDSPLSL
jgi:NADH:ubiquinone oxidoreductase subunit H